MTRNSTNQIYWGLVVLLLLAGPVVGYATKHIVADNEAAKARLIFADHLAKQVFLLEKEIGSLYEVLAGLKAFFESSESVTREEFASFTKDSLERYPTIKSLRWVPGVEDKWRKQHVNQTKATGLKHYCISALSASGELGMSPAQNVYYPVYYLASGSGEKSTLGYDLSSDAISSRAILEAIKEKTAVISDPIQLELQNGGNKDLLVLQHVRNSPSTSQKFSAASCQGLVLLELDLEAVIKSTLLKNADLNGASYRFELSDKDVAGSPMVMYSHTYAGETNSIYAGENSSWDVDVDIKTGGQIWSLKASPLPLFLNQHLTYSPVLLGIAAATIWELLWIAFIGIFNWSKSSIINRQKHILDSVLLSMAEGVIVADSQGQIILTNQAAELLLRLGSQKQIDGIKSLSSGCRLPDKITAFKDGDFPLTKAISGKQVRDKIMWIPAPHSSTHGTWLNANAAPLLDSDGTHQGGVLVLRNITDHKNSLEFSQRMGNAVDLTDDSVFITDKNGKIQYVNTAFEKTTGFSRKEALGKTPRILKSDINPEERYEELWTTILRGEVYRGMIVNQKKSGEVYYADQTVTPMCDLSGAVTHFVAVVKDMTEYRQLRQHEVEMDIAAKVQQKLFPCDPPPMDQLDIAGAVFSANATGGDYFDFIPMSHDRICMTVGDVSGHGIGSALVMAETRAYVRSLPPETHTPGEIMSQVNRNLIHDLSGSHFVTLILAYVDPNAGRLVYSSAGHDTCFLIGQEGQIKNELSSTGMPLGMFDLGDYPTSKEIQFQKGDILVLLTDGLTDCQAHLDRFLEVPECLALIHRNRQKSAREIIDIIYEHALEFMGKEPQNDDITIVICKAR